MEKKVKEIEACRSCGYKTLKPLGSLGNQYVTNFVSDNSELERIPQAPLDLVLCPEQEGGCGLLQLRHNTPPESMWGDQYWYKSGINRLIKEDLADIVENSL